MRTKIAVLVVFALITLAGCSKDSTSATGGQQATVTLKDGTTFSGTVAGNTADAITLRAASGESRTYPMAQIAGVKYEDAAAPAPASSSAAAPAPKPPVLTSTIAAGTVIEVRNNDSIDSQTASAGQTYSAVIAADVPNTDGGVAIAKGSNATLMVKAASGQGKIQGQSDLVVDLDSVEVGGRKYQLDTNDVVEKGTAGVGKNKRTAIFTGGGAVLGTVLGAVAGGGKGAAIGAASGAAAGTGTQAVTRGRPLFGLK